MIVAASKKLILQKQKSKPQDVIDLTEEPETTVQKGAAATNRMDLAAMPVPRATIQNNRTSPPPTPNPTHPGKRKHGMS